MNLSTKELSDDDCLAIADNLPSQVVVVGVNSHAPRLLSLLASRLQTLEINDALPVSKANDVEECLMRQTEVVLRAGYVVDGPNLVPSHWSRGCAGDAFFIHQGRGHVAIVGRESLFSLQRRFGLVGVRAQLERSLPEAYEPTLKGGKLEFTDGGGSLLRHPDGRWSVRPTLTRSVSIELEGVSSNSPPVTLNDGDTLRFGGEAWQFRTSPHDL